MPSPAISVLVPTRRRPALLCRMAGSLIQTCESIDNIELLLAFDSDDVETKQAWESSEAARRLEAAHVGELLEGVRTTSRVLTQLPSA